MARSAQQIEDSRLKMQRLGQGLSALFTGLAVLICACMVVIAIAMVMMILKGVSSDSSSTVSILVAPTYLVICGAAALTLRGISRDMAQGDSPFTAPHARRISLLGWLLVVVAVIELVASPGFMAFTIGPFSLINSPQAMIEELTLPIDMGAVLGAIACFSIAAIWRYGALLQEQAEDLV